MAKNTDRKTVELAKKRIPLKKLLHGKEIRQASKALEDFRLTFNEHEILFGAKLTIKVDTYGETYLVAHRLETDKEYADRLEKARAVAEAKRERAEKRKLLEAERAKRADQERKRNVVKSISEMVKANNLTVEELTALIISIG